MKLIKILFKTILGMVTVLVIVGVFLPSVSNVNRSTDINASRGKVFRYLNDFRQFNRWSPWARIDPDIKYQYEGPDQGLGSKVTWKSEHPNVGNGSQVITQSVPGEVLSVHLEFDGQGSGDASFNLEPENGGTQITWSFETEWGYNLPGRYMGLMMDKWVGAEYEKGLANLKQLVESE